MAKNTIKVKNYLHIQEELTAGGAITPGMLLALNSSGNVVAHSVAQATGAGTVLPRFALEDELQGKGISDAYANGARVQVWIPTRGDVVNALLATGQNAAIGAWLASNGDGTLKVVASAAADVDAVIVGQAVEALNNTSGSAQRLLVQIL